jgi:hypothetical protein
MKAKEWKAVVTQFNIETGLNNDKTQLQSQSTTLRGLLKTFHLHLESTATGQWKSSSSDVASSLGKRNQRD